MGGEVTNRITSSTHGEFHIDIHQITHSDSTLTMVKASKIEGMPKRPMSAYFLWMSEEGRAAAKEKLGDCGVAEISKCCGVMWKEVDEASRKKYEKKQAELKKKYDIEYPRWLENGGKELLDAAKAAKKAKKAESEEEEEEESEEDDE